MIIAPAIRPVITIITLLFVGRSFGIEIFFQDELHIPFNKNPGFSWAKLEAAAQCRPAD
jgi:hypothetical protein